MPYSHKEHPTIPYHPPLLSPSHPPPHPATCTSATLPPQHTTTARPHPPTWVGNCSTWCSCRAWQGPPSISTLGIANVWTSGGVGGRTGPPPGWNGALRCGGTTLLLWLARSGGGRGGVGGTVVSMATRREWEQHRIIIYI